MRAARNLLLLHTSAAAGVAAVACGDVLVCEKLDRLDPRTPTLLGAVQRLLDRLGIGIGALEGLVVTTGPGSFTGIRIGLATAQGLAAARGWQVHCCDSLLPAAAAVRGAGIPVAVVEDARRGEVYAALYDTREPGPSELVPPFCAAPEQAVARLGAGIPPGSPAAILGTGMAAVQAGLGRSVAIRRFEPPSPDALAAALLYLARRGDCRSIPPEALAPEYLRQPDATPPGGER